MPNSKSADVNETVRELMAYFASQDLPCDRVDSDWKIDLDAFRFYFVRANNNFIVLDIDQDLISNKTAAEIIAELETEKWRTVLESNLGKPIVFRDGHFHFNP
jgi:hypothetical protein